MNNKQLSQIKDLIKNNKRDRFVIFDNEEPALVVMSIEEYKKIAFTGKSDRDIIETDVDIDLVDNINRAIAEWKVNQADEEINDKINDYETMAREELDNSSDDFYDSDENLSYYYDMDESDN